LVRGAVLLDGPGLAGGAIHATSNTEITSGGNRTGTTPDPWALIELSRDARPPTYTTTFARLAVSRRPNCCHMQSCTTMGGSNSCRTRRDDRHHSARCFRYLRFCLDIALGNSVS
jgi:hypothetical protein